MDTQIKVFVKITFKLPTLDAREDLETKINTFIATQDPGSYRNNICRDTPEDPNHPFWFQTRMFINADTIAKVNSCRTTLLNALSTMPEVISYDFRMDETKAD